jgi:AP-4 complex subunit mu-1
VDGVNYFFSRKFGIYFVATTKHNVSPSMVHDIIYRMMKVFRDYCGVLNEESIRKNFVLIYEIIDEIIDYGHAQLVTTEQIRPLIVNEPILVKETNIDKKDKKKSWKPKFFKSSTVASTAIQKPISKIDNSAKAKKK